MPAVPAASPPQSQSRAKACAPATCRARKALPSGSFAVNGKFKSLPELRETIEKSGIDLEKPVVTTCGSGITAAIITLALESLGHGANRLYDGSWSEWGSRSDTRIVTGKD